MKITYGFNGNLRSPEKKFNINFTKANTKFCLSLHYNADKSSLNLMLIIKIFPAQFCLGSIYNGFSATESREVSLNVYDFSVNSIDKSDILNILKYLMTKNNIKECSAILNKCLLYYYVLVPL